MRIQIETHEVFPGLCQVLFEHSYIRRTDIAADKCFMFSDVKVCVRGEKHALVIDCDIPKYERNSVPTL